MVHDDGEEADGGGGVPVDQLRSYLAFGVRAVRRRRALSLTLFAVMLGLTIAVAKLWPRTYHCETRLIAQTSQVLAMRGDSVNDALRGAPDLVQRRENLESIVKKLDLARVMRERRPFLGRMKDMVTGLFRAPATPLDILDSLIWTLKDKLIATVQVSDATLTLAIDWPDAESSAQILELAENNFLEARHVAEIATIAEYTSILEGHTATVRRELEEIAKQVRDLKAKQRADILDKGKKSLTEDGTPVRRRLPMRTPSFALDEEVPKLQATLEAKRRALTDVEEYRRRRLQELQTKLADLQSKYTSAHPAIIDVQRNILTESSESQQASSLRSDIHEIQVEMDRRNAALKMPSGLTTTAGASSLADSAPLPAEIMSLIQDADKDLDPAVEAQLRYAVEKYTTLRGQISNARIELDTAQAAFKHRYKIILPPEVPTKALKPKVPLIFGAGLFLAIVVALLTPILSEFRAGRIVERWQVNELALPVLGELMFPPHPTEPPQNTPPPPPAS